MQRPDSNELLKTPQNANTKKENPKIFKRNHSRPLTPEVLLRLNNDGNRIARRLIY